MKKPEKFRVQKLLSNYGYCARRKAEDLIEQGRVKVNGQLVFLGESATEQDLITVNNKPVEPQNKVYLMFHKPLKCVTAASDDTFDTVLDYINIKERVFPVGRLDYNTSGLLILTNDGDFANQVAHPRHETYKTYLAKINQSITKEQVREIEEGVKLRDGWTRPAKVKLRSRQYLEITIHEGKNRIVRRILEHFRFKVVTLQRIKIGKLTLGPLKLGKFRYLGEHELDKIFKK